MTETINVEVVFATPERQMLVAIELAVGTTVADAISESGLQSKFPEVQLDTLECGIWGRRVERDQALENGDRVEIYRPLLRDPRDARRALAKDQSSESSS